MMSKQKNCRSESAPVEKPTHHVCVGRPENEKIVSMGVRGQVWQAGGHCPRIRPENGGSSGRDCFLMYSSAIRMECCFDCPPCTQQDAVAFFCGSAVFCRQARRDGALTTGPNAKPTGLVISTIAAQNSNVAHAPSGGGKQRLRSPRINAIAGRGNQAPVGPLQRESEATRLRAGPSYQDSITEIYVSSFASSAVCEILRSFPFSHLLVLLLPPLLPAAEPALRRKRKDHKEKPHSPTITCWNHPKLYNPPLLSKPHALVPVKTSPRNMKKP